MHAPVSSIVAMVVASASLTVLESLFSESLSPPSTSPASPPSIPGLLPGPSDLALAVVAMVVVVVVVVVVAVVVVGHFLEAKPHVSSWMYPCLNSHGWPPALAGLSTMNSLFLTPTSHVTEQSPYALNAPTQSFLRAVAGAKHLQNCLSYKVPDFTQALYRRVLSPNGSKKGVNSLLQQSPPSYLGDSSPSLLMIL